ncbi:MAG: tRNA (guanosine(46)-N7)-methyltransferase TrmB [Candidatus Sumerlaeota bacterium]|nr:tRNA (guanosine(46)-N7)-methyltransferase TrmB [Candidatus Sumerlaeota bacterium]
MTRRGPRSSSTPGGAPLPEAGLPTTWLDLAPQPAPLVWREVFGRAAPVELEIGCGNGRFLAREAPRRPEACFLGIEQSRKYSLMAARRLEKQGAANARAACAVAEEFLAERVARGSLAAVHIYFSDPWPKRRHARRRLFQWTLLNLLADAAGPGAALHVKTDVDWYFELIMSLFIEHPAFELLSFGEQLEFPEEDLEMTGFESKAHRLGGRVFFLEARRLRDARA